MEMGCYGIGVSRIVAAAIEQNNDERGILWPRRSRRSRSPSRRSAWQERRRSARWRSACTTNSTAAGIEVLLDDRDERPGVMFADLELIGIPHRIMIGERGLKQGWLEYQGRRDSAAQQVPLAGTGSLRESEAVRFADPRRDRSVCCLPRLALAGAQRYEPLAASVQAALQRAVAIGPRRSSLSIRNRTHAIGSATMSRRLERHMPDGRSPPRFPRTVHYEAHARGARPAAGARPDPGRKQLSQVRGVAAPARAATCRSCRSGSASSALPSTICSTCAPTCATAA